MSYTCNDRDELITNLTWWVIHVMNQWVNHLIIFVYYKNLHIINWKVTTFKFLSFVLITCLTHTYTLHIYNELNMWWIIWVLTNVNHDHNTSWLTRNMFTMNCDQYTTICGFYTTSTFWSFFDFGHGGKHVMSYVQHVHVRHVYVHSFIP